MEGIWGRGVRIYSAKHLCYLWSTGGSHCFKTYSETTFLAVYQTFGFFPCSKNASSMEKCVPEASAKVPSLEISEVC